MANEITKSSDIPFQSFKFIEDSKPQQAIDTVFDTLLPWGKKIEIAKGEVHTLSTDFDNAGIILLNSGVCSICHKESGLFIYSAFTKTILGLIDAYSLFYKVETRPQHYLFAETDCNGYFVPLSDFLTAADTYALWHDIARILAHRLMAMSARENELVGVNSYSKVRAILIELWHYPDELKQQINILNIIQRRTNLSKSRTMKILSELKKGSYINIESGKLTGLTNLPKAF
jgi:hypothetical protein